MKTLINLIGGQTIPNLIAYKFCQPMKIILLYSKGSEKIKDNFKNSLDHLLFEEQEIDPYNYDNIYQTVKKLISKNVKNELILNFTSGTKIMSLASFDAFKTENILSIYIDSEHDNVYKFKDDHSVIEKLDIKISSKEYLNLNGHNFEFDQPRSVDGARANYYEYLENNYNEQIRKFVDKINTEYEKDKNSFYKNEFRFNDKNFKYFWDNHRQTSIIIFDGNEFEISGKDSVKYISGLWFEDLVYNKKFLTNNIYEEINRNVHIKQKSGKQDMIELDIICQLKGSLHLFELKSGKPRREALNNLRTIKEQLGTYTKLFLISYFALNVNDPLMERMEDLGIKYFTYHSFQLDKCIGNINVNL